ncbi:MAG TPA: class I SAM-dependent methyltransferase [Acidimicrobiia bacterium]|nr:class I SAM-dependent methyltransferase [Acidimicrobiia bacterium]
MTTTIEDMSTEQEDMSTEQAEAFAGRIFESVIGMLDGWSIYVGDKLGLYEALASKPLTRDELVSETSTHWRYVGEWLEQQVTTGILEVDDPAAPAEERVYSLPAGHREVLTDRDSLNYLTPFVRLVTAGGIQLPALLEAYRSGGGVSWEQFGPDMRTGQAEMNRPWFMNEIGVSWFPTVPALHERLSRPDARVADIGCGEGWSSIAIAKAYPGLTVDGYDVDEASMAAARGHASAEGVADRVRFHTVDGADISEAGQYDVVTLFECLHDMSDPVSVLDTARRLAKEDGQVVVMDEAVGDAFGDRQDEVERLMYGFSLFICLPDGLSHENSVGTGTVMRPAQLEAYAISAGFTGISVLPIANDLWRFYQLH